ncbi:probable proline--tRNA ligase, mitochondrial [Trichonephila clavipes]|uniref:Probable proline--tRNA ligase, mitochondrial n=1 Tax=Trichonephila clavipes TaxID=2585209 RepID=A0A8X6WE42_TRICX|nr:probable proline--tRNA ligase, mitochondrial [Trichonephila clavipes]
MTDLPCRWEGNDNLFKLKDRHSTYHCLAATHEEIATNFVSRLHVSYKNLPLRVYQISSKFRDEMNPKLGLLRGKEFLMKDMYTFDSNEKNSQVTYEALCSAYSQLFRMLGINAMKVKGSSGDIGGKSSHEFHFISDVGEDELLYCPKCRNGINGELYEGKTIVCEACNISYEKCNGIEVGHAFLLGTTYSKPFQAKFGSSENVTEILQMGCYGLGLSRILAASVECLSKDDSIRWPFLIAPFYVSVIPPKKGSKEEYVQALAYSLAESLTKISWLKSNIIIDDRTNFTIGKRINEASSLGIPYVVVVSKRLSKTPKESYVMLVCVHEDQALSMKCVYKWFAVFERADKVFLTKSIVEDQRLLSVKKTLRK